MNPNNRNQQNNRPTSPRPSGQPTSPRPGGQPTSPRPGQGNARPGSQQPTSPRPAPNQRQGPSTQPTAPRPSTQPTAPRPTTPGPTNPAPQQRQPAQKQGGLLDLSPYVFPAAPNAFFKAMKGLFTNSHHVPIPDELTIYKHDVQVETQRKKLRKEIISRFRQNVLRQCDLDPDYCVSDGSFIFTMQVPLPSEALRSASMELVKAGTTEHTVSVSNVTLLSAKNPEHRKSIIHAYNVAFGAVMDRSGMIRIGRSYFIKSPLDDKHFGQLASEILVLPGFFTELSFKLLGGKPCITLIVDPTSKILSKYTVLDTLYHIEQSVPENRLYKEIEEQLIGKIIMTKYDYQSYMIEDVDYNQTPMSSFHLEKEDRDITFFEYYRAKNILIKYKDQPLIKVTSRRKPIYLIPELCLMTELTDRVEAEVPKVCSIKPPERVLRMSTLLDLLETNKESQRLLTKFSIVPQKTPIDSLKSSMARPPKIHIVGSDTFSPGEGGWGPKTKGLKFSRSIMKDLKLLVTVEENCRNDHTPVIEGIKQELISKNAVSSVLVKIIMVPKNSLHSSVIDATIKPVLKSGAGLWLAIISSKFRNKEKYEDVKSTSLREQIKSQCITDDKLFKPKSFIIANVMKQIVNKLGHLCWTVDLTATCPSLPNETLFVGIDVYHAPKVLIKGTLSRRPSIVGFVAVYFKNGSFQFFNDVVTLEGGKELHGQRDNSEQKTDHLKKFLRRIAEDNRSEPKQVIVYRDGVGDGQMDIVKETEVSQVRAAYPKALLDFVVVKKRIHNKFVLPKDGSYCNPPPGTVVNDLHNLEEENAFYLISTISNVSTVKPVHYVFLMKQSKIPMPEFQNLTFALCHLYPNWPDAIKLPLPTQLAHKLAWQVGECIKPKPQDTNTQIQVGPSLFGTMHYL